MTIKTFRPEDVAGRKVLVRVDFNVPLKEGRVADDTRIRAHLPALNRLIGAGARIALVSHLGRPKGGPDPKYSLRPVGERLAEILGRPVRFVDECVGDEVARAMETLKPGEILLLENVRFHPEEEKNDPAFSARLAAPFDAFVMDAFSAAHRAHASTRGVADHLPSFAGDLIVREMKMLSSGRDHPRKPFVLILGGAKVSDKIAVIENLLCRVDRILIGGGMAFTFLKAQGYGIGRSLLETDRIDFAREMIRKAKEGGVQLLLPEDVLAAEKPEAGSPCRIVPATAIPEDLLGLDVGPLTRELFRGAILDAKTVLWNGPMGVFEIPEFAEGTTAVAQALADATLRGAVTLVGGGDSAAAVAELGFADRVSHVSTGGGASLEFFEGKTLPGIEPFLE
jgi:phosphoglycerate kinase